MPLIFHNIYKLWYGLSWRKEELKPTASFQLHTKTSYWTDRAQISLRRVTETGTWRLKIPSVPLERTGRNSLVKKWDSQTSSSIFHVTHTDKNCNFSPVSATGKDLSSSSSTHYDALARPGGSCCPPEVHSMLPAPTAAFKGLAKAFLATAYKHLHPPGLLLSPSLTQHNCEHINKPTAHAH